MAAGRLGQREPARCDAWTGMVESRRSIGVVKMQEGVSVREKITAAKGAKPAGPYSHAIACSGLLLFVSGQGAFHPETGEMPDTFEAAARQTLENVKIIVEAAGATMADVVSRVSEQVFIPLTVGGGVRTIEDMRRMLEAGADKTSVNTEAVKHPALISEGARRFGSQCIVVAIDARRGSGQGGPRWEVLTHGGRQPTGFDAVEWAKQAVELGCGEILLTSWDEDGRKTGYDIELTRTVSESVTVPVIASGGAGTLEHLKDALVIGKADAVLAASIFHYRTFSIEEAKRFLAENGIPVRLPRSLAGA